MAINKNTESKNEAEKALTVEDLLNLLTQIFGELSARGIGIGSRNFEDSAVVRFWGLERVEWTNEDGKSMVRLAARPIPPPVVTATVAASTPEFAEGAKTATA